MDTNEQIFNENIKLAYKIANKYKNNYNAEFEDIKQCALLGLWKTVKTFDKTKGFAFSTLAYRIITNEINMYLRKESKYIKLDLLSLDYALDDKESNLYDYLCDNNDNYIIDNFLCELIIQEYNKLKPLHQKIIQFMFEDKTQKEISKKLNCSQPQISRVQTKFIKNIKEKYNLGGG